MDPADSSPRSSGRSEGAPRPQRSRQGSSRRSSASEGEREPGSSPRTQRSGGESRGASAGRSSRPARDDAARAASSPSESAGRAGRREPPKSSRQAGRGRRPSQQTRDARTRRPGAQRLREDVATGRTESQAAYDGPPIPEDFTGKELDRSVSAALKSLPEKLAARVARHLAAAAAVLATDPETAYAHTVAARARAARVAVVREASGEAAYAAGRFKDALAEFRAARRMNSSPRYLPMMADSERGLGRPERALALAKEPAVAELDEDGQIEMKIVESGARRDLGDTAAAIRTLEGRELRSRSRAPWVPRLRYAYAEALLADGQVDAAREWFERAAGVDAEGLTDAAERVAELEAGR